MIHDPVAPDGADFDAALRLRRRVRAVMLDSGGEPDLTRERVAIPADAGVNRP